MSPNVKYFKHIFYYSDGYIPVESVELNIQEMMVLGNKSKATNRTSVNGFIDPEAPSTDIM